LALSLQEQLLKAGLVDQKKVKQVNKDKRKNAKQQRHTKEPVVDIAKEAAAQALKDKTERDRKLNEERNQRAEHRAVVAQIKQLIDTNKITRDKGETPYNFVDNSKVKKMYVTDDQHRQLSNGQLAIASFQKSYELIPAPVAHKIAERDASYIIIASNKNAVQEAEDEYGDYKIPDDLMW
jgi:uncharacterized protein YaiL (DUF2058 family)